MTAPFEIISPSIGIDQDREGLLFISDMKPKGATLPNLAGGADGVISGAKHGVDRFGHHLYFDGYSSRVVLNNITSINTTKCIEIWVSSTQEAALSYLYDTEFGRFTLRWNTVDVGYIGYYDGNTAYNCGLAPDDGYPHHLMAVFCGSTGKSRMYIDGSMVGVATDYNPTQIGGWSAIGSRYTNSSSPSYFNGKIYSFKVATSIPDNEELYAKGCYSNGITAMWKFCYGLNASTVAISGRVENSGIVALTGTYKIIDETISGESCKTLECQTTGTIQMPDRNMGDVDNNNRCMYDDGTGYDWIDLTVTSGVVSMTSGDKMLLASQGGTFDFTKKLLP